MRRVAGQNPRVGRPAVSLLSIEIGRGHPFYLDGVEHALRRAAGERLDLRRASVFEVSHGGVRLGWRGLRAAYRMGGSGGVPGAAYRGLRGLGGTGRSARLAALLCRDARGWAGEAGLLLVDHPLLATGLRGRPGIVYVHGELAAPVGSLVNTPARVIVPSQSVAEAFRRAGMPEGGLLVSGPCVEDALLSLAEPALGARQRRLASADPLAVGLFSSGAEPRPHVETLAAAASALVSAGHRVVAFAAKGGRFERTLRRRPSLRLEVVGFADRRELTRRTAEHFPALDLVVAPPHERSHWALALGLPFFLVGPDVGPFAPLNRRVLLETGVALGLEGPGSARRLPDWIASLRREGRLLEMSRRGWGLPRDGFEVAARGVLSAALP